MENMNFSANFYDSSDILDDNKRCHNDVHNISEGYGLFGHLCGHKKTVRNVLNQQNI